MIADDYSVSISVVLITKLLCIKFSSDELYAVHVSAILENTALVNLIYWTTVLSSNKARKMNNVCIFSHDQVTRDISAIHAIQMMALFHSFLAVQMIFVSLSSHINNVTRYMASHGKEVLNRLNGVNVIIASLLNCLHVSFLSAALLICYFVCLVYSFISFLQSAIDSMIHLFIDSLIDSLTH